MAAAKKKKKWLRLCVLLLVIVALVGVYFLLDKKESPLPEDNPGGTTQDEAKTVVLCPWKPEDIQALSFQNERFFATIEKQENGSFLLAEEPDFPLDQNKAQNAFTNVCTQAESVVVTDAELSVYGLETPAIRITARTKTGEEYRINVGNKIGTVSKTGYYACLDGQDTVYEVSAALFIVYNMEKAEWIMPETLPMLDPATIVGVEIESEEFEELALYHTGEVGDGDGNPSTGNWRMEKPYSNILSISDGEVTEQMTNYNSIHFANAVDYRRESFSDYGLETPVTTLTLFYETGSDLTGDIVRQKLRLNIGTQNEAGDYYVNLNGSPRVYLMTGANVRGLVAPDIESFVEKRFSLLFIHTISELEVQLGNTRHLYEMTHEDVTDESGQSTTKKSHFVVDGVPVSDESTSFNTFYTCFVKPQVSWVLDEDTQPTQKEPLITLRYKRTEPTYNNLVIEYFPYDDSFYAARINGIMMYAVDKRDIDSMINEINNYVPD